MSPPVLSDELLEAYESRLRSVRAPIVRRFRPGLADAEIDAIAETAGLTIPSEARTWWSWHTLDPDQRGAPELAGIGWQFLELTEAIDEAAEWREDDQVVRSQPGNEGAPPTWKDGWVPVFRAGHAAVSVIDCGGAVGSVSPVYYVSPEEETTANDPPRADSLGTVITWWIDAFDSGAYYLRPRRHALTFVPDKIDPVLDLTRLV